MAWPRRPHARGSVCSSRAAAATSARVLVRAAARRAATTSASSTASTGATSRWRTSATEIELIDADVREIPPEALGRRRRRHPPRRPLERPDGRVRPRGELADERARRPRRSADACVERGIERLVFASSCSLYDGLPPAMHDEAHRGQAPRRVRRVEALRRARRCSALVDDGLCPVILRNGTVYGYSPRMRFDLVVNTFVKDALLKGELSLHGGGWMWRPLVDVRDAADAMIAALEAPADQRPRRDLQRPPRQLPDPRAGDARRRLGRSCSAARSRLEEVPAAGQHHPQLRVLEREARASGSASSRASRSSTPSPTCWRGSTSPTRPALTDPRCYNIRWLELLHELKPRLESLSAPFCEARARR